MGPLEALGGATIGSGSGGGVWGPDMESIGWSGNIEGNEGEEPPLSSLSPSFVTSSSSSLARSIMAAGLLSITL